MHNIFTLGKHVAGSVNREAGKLDNYLYGPPTPYVPNWFDLHPIITGIGAVILVTGIISFFIFVNIQDSNNGCKNSGNSGGWWFFP